MLSSAAIASPFVSGLSAQRLSVIRSRLRRGSTEISRTRAACATIVHQRKHASRFETSRLFATYHLHTPWVIPTALADTFALAYPSRRSQTASCARPLHSVH